MDVIRDWRNVPSRLRGSTVALGNFDGVHRGHQWVISVTQARANELSAPSGVISFNPHPRRFFTPGRPFFRLTPQPLKLRLVEALGVDVTFVVSFDAMLASMSPEAFVADVLVAGLGVRHVVAGWNYRFGAKRAGDATTLEHAAEAHGVGVTILKPEQDQSGTPFSSTRIRQLLSVGDIKAAARLLGYRWRIVERVIGGDQRGHDLGFPTINMLLDDGIDLAHGIYAVRVHVDGGVHGGAAYHGARPTYDGREALLETYIFDFSGELYGREIEIEFVEYLRADRRFESPSALAAQMAVDCAAAREALDTLVDDDLLGDLRPVPVRGHHSATIQSDV